MTLEEKIKNFEKELCDDCKNDKVHLTAECGLETKMINPQWTIKLMQECVEEEHKRILGGLPTEYNPTFGKGAQGFNACLSQVKSLINKSN